MGEGEVYNRDEMLASLAFEAPSRAKVQVSYRVAAKAIDLILSVALAVLLPYPLGPLLGFGYSVCADGIRLGGFSGQSVGKRLLKLQVVHSKTGKPAGIRESALRNAPVGVMTFFAIIPVWGWFFVFLVGIPLTLIEVYLMLTVEGGHRLGDVMGDTVVRRYRAHRPDDASG